LVQSGDTLSGAVRFAGTRVPVQALLDRLAHGLPVSDFLEGIPDVTEDQANAVVASEHSAKRLKPARPK